MTPTFYEKTEIYQTLLFANQGEDTYLEAFENVLLHI